MSWFRRKPPASPIQAPPTSPPVDAFLSLITALSEQSARRYAAQLEHEAKLEELSLKRHEIEVQNAETMAKAESEKRESLARLRQQRKEYGTQAQQKYRATKRLSERCRVCQDGGNPGLTAMEIQWHHSGHPAGQIPLLNTETNGDG